MSSIETEDRTFDITPIAPEERTADGTPSMRALAIYLTERIGLTGHKNYEDSKLKQIKVARKVGEIAYLAA